MTFRLFESQIVGGTKCRPLILRRSSAAFRRADARLSPSQNEVRAEQSSASNLFRKKVALLCDFRQVFCLFYPFRHRFEPASPLLFKFGGLLLQRLLFRKKFCFFLAIYFLLNDLFQVAVKKSLELCFYYANFSSCFLNKSGYGLGGFLFVLF